MASAMTPVELIPARRQTVWRAPAVANFVLSGVGAGLYITAALAGGLGSGPSVRVAPWLGPALVLAGFAAVATEAGRPLRGLRVLRRVDSSWMSRELWLGLGFVAAAVLELVAPTLAGRLLAPLAALGLVVAQGFMLCTARGVTAWSVPAMPALFVVSALLSGLGLLLLVERALGHAATPALAGAGLVLLPFGLLVWLVYLTWSADPVFVHATRALREGPAAVAVIAAGYVLPLVLLAIGLVAPAAAGWTPALAGALMVAGQAGAKWLVIIDAGLLRPITLSTLSLPGRTS